MDPYVVFTIRYSILQAGTHQWSVSRQAADLDDYRAKLFDPDRLALHHHLFARVTLPSIRTQTGLDPARHRVFVISSTELPDAARRALEETLAPLPWAEARYVAPEGRAPHGTCVHDFLTGRGVERALYAHARLDDDDALSADYLDALDALASPGTAGMAISFGAGYDAVLSEDRQEIATFHRRYRPKTAIGIARIGLFEAGTPAADLPHAYALGDHMTIDKRTPLITDSRSPRYLRTVYPEQDTAGAAAARLGPEAPRAEARARFPFL